MTKYAKDIVRGDTIILDCGYNLSEDYKPCKVISREIPLPLFEDSRSEDYISFEVNDGSSKFNTIGYPPFYSFEIFNSNLNRIEKILMERDNMSQEDAEDLFYDAKEEAQVYLDNDGSIDDIENVLKDYFGLEPDYIFDLIDL